jgi:hypothetical protein
VIRGLALSAVLAVLGACGGGGDGGTAAFTARALVWDEERWDEAGWQ